MKSNDTGSSFKRTLLYVFGIFFISLLLLSFLYPDLWFYHDRRLLASKDTLGPLISTFMLVSHFFQGGVQLFSRFDQMNNAYFVLSNGIYGVINLITAIIFIILSPFITHPAVTIQQMHLFMYYGLTCFILTVGGYLLLSKLVFKKSVIFISLLYLNLIMTSYMMSQGSVTQGEFCFLPLLMYFILSFFETFRLREFLLALLVMVLCLANSFLFTLGYFYQIVHFFILSCGAGFLFQRGWRKFAARPSLPQRESLINLVLAGCCTLIILPYFFWGQALTHDFYVPGSGLGGTQGRFNAVFSLSKYFIVDGKSFANPLDFFNSSLNYQHVGWGDSWLFMGASSLFFAVSAIVLSIDKRKYLFLATIIFIILINTACFPGNIAILGQYIQAALHDPLAFWSRGIQVNEWVLYTWLWVASIAHGINALTNPFSFLVRSFQIPALLVPMMFLPLVAMGLESCFWWWERKERLIHFKRRWILLAFGGMILFGSQGWSPTLKGYVLSLGAIFMSFMLMAEFLHSKKTELAWVVLGIVFALEFMALRTYVQIYPKDHVIPIKLDTVYTTQAVFPDYQNPEILPFREFFNIQNKDTHPPIFEAGAQSMVGAFYRYTPISRYFSSGSLYVPSHVSYKDLSRDPEAQEYLIRNPRGIFFADEAFDSRYVSLSQILKDNLNQRVIMVDQEPFNRSFLKTTQQVYIPAMNFKEKFYKTYFSWDRAVIHHGSFGWEYAFELPKDFPPYLSTTIFTYDHASWKLMMGNKMLEAVQGELRSPFTYDVQNIQKQKIMILLPSKSEASGELVLMVKLPDRIFDVWKNTDDAMGLTYEAPQDGWLVFNYPYDKKWELSIDGRKMPLSRVNRYFMGASISEGKHQVLLRYWSKTPLRWLILISIGASLISFFWLIFYSMKREQA